MYVVIDADSVNPPAERIPLPHAGHFFINLLACLGYPLTAPPVAQLLCCLHGLTGTWLVVSPILWHASHNDAFLVATGGELELSPAQQQKLFELYRDFVIAEKMQLFYHDASTWLLKVDDAPPLNAPPVYLLRGQSMWSSLYNMDRTMFWPQFMTASQMFFKQHFDSHPVNGVWIWGQGQLNPPINQPIFCSDNSLMPLAQCLSTQVRCYTSGVHLTSDSLLLASEAPILPQQSQTIDWYWNNDAYRSKPKHWLARLLRRGK